jgi:biotin carboxyl carrier protein
VDLHRVEPGVWSVIIDGQQLEVAVEKDGAEYVVTIRGRTQRVAVPDPRAWESSNGDRAAAGVAKVASPMPGKIVRILVGPGDRVEAGAGLLVVEAMKMQNELKSPLRGKIVMISAAEGAAVTAKQTLVVVEADAD